MVPEVLACLSGVVVGNGLADGIVEEQLQLYFIRFEILP